MPEFLTQTEFNLLDAQTIIVDVRKSPARLKSGLTLPGAVWRRPFAAEGWWQEFSGKKLVVFCVHGHEVGMAVAGFLNDQGIAARYLEGGFEAYRASGGIVIAIEVDDDR